MLGKFVANPVRDPVDDLGLLACRFGLLSKSGHLEARKLHYGSEDE
jgi:hypothetical protein